MDDWQKIYSMGGKFKQQLDEIASIARGGVEREPEMVQLEKAVEMVEEIPVAPEVEKKPEIAGYIEKVEKEAELAPTVVDDYTQQILMTAPSSQAPQVTLPLTEEEITQGLHHKVWESVRWLAEWCVRQVKKLHGAVKYRMGSTSSASSG